MRGVAVESIVRETDKRIDADFSGGKFAFHGLRFSMNRPPNIADPNHVDLAMPEFNDRIAVCEPRLALSVSAAADLFVQALAVDNHLPDPLADAAAIRHHYSLDGAGQSVAVIDSGIAWNHVAFTNQNRDLAPGIGPGQRVVAGWDFAENDADPYDDGPAGYHGTHIAGTLAAITNSFTGVAPGADLVALRVFDDFGRGSLDWIESALRWVIDHRTSLANPITTVNLSLGAFAYDTSQPLTQLDDELQTLHDNGVIVVAAAGNSFDAAQADSLAYPASHPLVAAVTSVDASGSIQPFAQRTEGVFAAPGSAIRSSVPDHVLGADGSFDDFASVDGTSMATPQFAGATILVRQAMQALGLDPTPADILTHLRNTAANQSDPISGATYQIVDLQNAIDSLLGSNHETTPETNSSPLQWISQSAVTIQGTDNADRIIVNLNQPISITFNDTVYTIDRPLESLRIEAGVGNDVLELIGSAADERLIARAPLDVGSEASASLQQPDFSAEFTGFENLVFRGGGGKDRATLFDSVSDDTFEANANQATLRGVGFTFVAADVRSVYAHATGGGNDTAYLYDSASDDRLAIRNQFSSLRSAQHFQLAYGFEKVYAFAGNGGHNEADLYDSPGDDRFNASAAFASISGRDYYAGARGFATVRAEATAGGYDYASLYASDTSTLWTRSTNLLQWTDTGGATRSAQGFELADAFVAGQKVEILPQAVMRSFFAVEREAMRKLFATQ